MQQPPLLPDVILSRVVRLARFDGISVLVLGTLFAISAATMRDAPFAAVGLLAAGAGAVELHGIGLLRQGEPRGMSWLIASQPFLFVVILGYCVLRATHFEMPPIPEKFRELVELSARQWKMSVEDYFHLINRITVVALGVVAFFYQGGMTLYYWRRRAAVRLALAAE